MNKRKKVVQTVRKELNHLMVIEIGCRVLEDDKYGTIIDVQESDFDGEYYQIKWDKSYVDEYSLAKLDDFKIIGKEPTILNLLEVLRFKSKEDFVPLLDCTGKLNYYKDNFYIDLKKHYVKDLDDEIIDFLHKILCN